MADIAGTRDIWWRRGPNFRLALVLHGFTRGLDWQAHADCELGERNPEVHEHTRGPGGRARLAGCHEQVRKMFEVQPGPVSREGKPLVLNGAGKQVEVSNTEMRDGRVVLLDRAGKAIAAPKLIVPKRIPLEQLQRLRPQQQLLPEPLTEREVMLMRPAAAHVQTLQRLQPRAVNVKSSSPSNSRSTVETSS